ncbi:endonuclease III [Geoalkalibacter subterraneus]|uniref:endonuclease III n=1 Tax=Geoalkalibacter subterraneus TaxID=483547 RepID=UPI000AD8E89A|nr:endonuclease III [Geoalkalibacter subterraneus]
MKNVNKHFDPSNEVDCNKALRVLGALELAHQDAHCALHHESAWQLLVATILSAQCTDERVNQVTPALFDRFPGPLAMCQAPVQDVEELIRSTGFFRNKARHLLGCGCALAEKYQGQVPIRMNDLVQLPGVGRKTANVIRGVAFGRPAVVVDTHVKRIAQRLGWTRKNDPVGIERDLMRLLPRNRWTHTGHVMIFHGRRICRAPTPQCSICPVASYCPRYGVDRSR